MNATTTETTIRYDIRCNDTETPSAWMDIVQACTPAAQDSGRVRYHVTVAAARTAELEAALEADADVLEYTADDEPDESAPAPAKGFALLDLASGVTEQIDALDIDDAKEQAIEWAREGDYHPEESTSWVAVRILRDGEAVETVSVSIDPDEPDCDDGEEHDWRDDGVRGHGGGVIVRELCARCACARITDTWAQNPCNGVQGLTSLSYERAE